jgi:hypothetical protein
MNNKVYKILKPYTFPFDINYICDGDGDTVIEFIRRTDHGENIESYTYFASSKDILFWESKKFFDLVKDHVENDLEEIKNIILKHWKEHIKHEKF